MTGENLTSAIGGQQGIEIFDEGERRPRRRRPALTHEEAAREIPVFAETDCWWWAAARQVPPRRSPPGDTAPTSCWWSVTTTSAGFPPAAS